MAKARKRKTPDEALMDCCAILAEWGFSGAIAYRRKNEDGDWVHGAQPIDGDIAATGGIVDYVCENWDRITKTEPPDEPE